MPVEIKIAKTTDNNAWDGYIRTHPQASAYHQAAWGKVVQQTYGHKVYNLMALSTCRAETEGSAGFVLPEGKTTTVNASVVGVLPLVHIDNFLFGNNLFSLPFADLGGILADGAEVEKALLARAAEIAVEQGIPTVELRQTAPLTESILPPEVVFTANSSQRPAKVRMLLNLPDSSAQLLTTFKSKLRSQIRRPLKDGLVAKVGGIELLHDFYTVFAENMRDLGSPVHSKKFFKNLLQALPGSTRIFMVYKATAPVACSFTLEFGHVLANPWASALRRYSRYSPNMLLYWTMFEYACDSGCTIFDLGRSTPGAGTYNFKKQWGAEDSPLYWQTISSQAAEVTVTSADQAKFDLAMRVWKRLPVSVSKAIGPVIRKNIGL